MRQQISKPNQAPALHRAPVAQRQQPAQPPPAVPGLRIGDDIRRAICKHQPRADDQFEVQFRRFLHRLTQRNMRADDTGNRVAISDADAGLSQCNGFGNHLLSVRCTAQEGIIGGGDKVGEHFQKVQKLGSSRGAEARRGCVAW